MLPADSVVRAPATATDVAASTLPMNALTARSTLHLVGLRPGQVLAVTGAAGAHGGYVVQLAKADGAVQDERVLPAVRDGGAVATVRGYRGPGGGERGLRFFPTLVRRVARDRAALDRLRQQAEDGVLSLRVDRALPAEDAAEAHRLLAGGGVRGRLVLTF
ncbi:zinc-binding dehydrogenase [Geodermatophilus sp. SYSU D00691]